MKFIFETDTVEIDETDLLIVGFFTEDNYFMIQQSLGEYDEQDIILGMNTYHIERDDQSHGGYGGIQEILLQRNKINVRLNEIGQKNLDCEEVEINFQTDDEKYKLLTEKLAFIFGDSLILPDEN